MYQAKLPKLNALAQKLRGYTGTLGGQTWSVYRNGVGVNQNVLSGTPVLTGYQSMIERTTSKAQVEGTIFDLLCFESHANNTGLEIFDEFVATGYGAEPQDVYALVSMRPLLQTLWMRAESQATFTRPTPASGSFADQPASGPMLAPNYIASILPTERPLTLIDGAFAFATDPNAVAATVQVGIQPIRRVRDDSTMADVPEAFVRSDFLAWAPVFDGAPLQERDRLNVLGLGTFTIGSLFTTDVTGIAGYVLVIEKVHLGQTLS